MTEQTAKPQDNRPWFKKKRFIIPGALLGLSILGSQLDSESSAAKAETKPATEEANSKNVASKGMDLKTKIQNNIKSLDGDDLTSNSLKDATSFTIATALFKAYAMTINEGKASNDPEVLKLTKELEKKVIASQQKNFPKLRKAYFEMVKEKLWENDVDVRLSGSGNTILTFVGTYFAANRNIKASQEALQEMLTNLRFKQTNYKWIKHDDEYTYYTISSPKDTEIVE